jgi:ketosteroid isomerase-like protein
MKIWYLTMLLTTLVLPAFSQGVMHADVNAPDEAEVRKLELDLAQMVIHSDWDQYAARLMDDYSASDRNGATRDKAASMAAFRDGKEKILDLAPEELNVRVYGDTAIVTGHFTMVQRRNGRVDTFFARETHVYLKRGGKWFLAASQATSVAK